MSDVLTHRHAGAVSGQHSTKPGFKAWGVSLIALGLVAGGVIAGPQLLASPVAPAAAPAAPSVAVSAPVQRDVAGRLEILGQFSAVQSVELRAQVGGTLTQIGFKDGDIVHKGDLLFEIDPTPYQIKLNEGIAQLESANSRLELATRELNRANELRLKNVIPPQDLDQRVAEKQAAEAAVDSAKAAIADAKF